MPFLKSVYILVRLLLGLKSPGKKMEDKYQRRWPSATLKERPSSWFLQLNAQTQASTRSSSKTLLVKKPLALKLESQVNFTVQLRSFSSLFIQACFFSITCKWLGLTYRWAQATRSCGGWRKRAGHSDCFVEPISRWKTWWQAALLGVKERLQQKAVAHSGRSHIQQQIHPLQHHARPRVPVQGVRQEWHGLLQAIRITKVADYQ